MSVSAKQSLAMQFAWSTHAEPGRARDLLVWLRPRGTWEWTRFRVTPNVQGEYECHAFGYRVFAIQEHVADLLVRLLPGRLDR